MQSATALPAGGATAGGGQSATALPAGGATAGGVQRAGAADHLLRSAQYVLMHPTHSDYVTYGNQGLKSALHASHALTRLNTGAKLVVAMSARWMRGSTPHLLTGRLGLGPHLQRLQPLPSKGVHAVVMSNAARNSGQHVAMFQWGETVASRPPPPELDWQLLDRVLDGRVQNWKQNDMQPIVQLPGAEVVEEAELLRQQLRQDQRDSAAKQIAERFNAVVPAKAVPILDKLLKLLNEGCETLATKRYYMPKSDDKSESL